MSRPSVSMPLRHALAKAASVRARSPMTRSPLPSISLGVGRPDLGSPDADKHLFEQSENAGGARRIMRQVGDHVADKLKPPVRCCLLFQDFDDTGPGCLRHDRSQIPTENVRSGFQIVEVFVVKQADIFTEQPITIAGIQIRLDKIPEVFRVAPSTAILPAVIPGDEFEQGQTRWRDALRVSWWVAPDPH